jgi:adenylate kinase family enzyme
LRKEVKSKSPEGKIINARFKAYEFVDDRLVIDIVHKEIRKCEENGESWIC